MIFNQHGWGKQNIKGGIHKDERRKLQVPPYPLQMTLLAPVGFFHQPGVLFENLLLMGLAAEMRVIPFERTPLEIYL